MSVINYFSSDANIRAKFMFDFIAPIYGKVDGALVKSYSKSIELLDNEVSIAGKRVLDIGTGTGAWAAKFLSSDAAYVQGVDISPKMLNESKKKHNRITFVIGNAEDLHEIKDNTFDIVTASYVVHGVRADRRASILSEMKRISRKHVVIHDFVGRTPLFVRFLEFIEKSDYKNFKRNFCDELKSFFPETKKISSVNGSGLYIAAK